MNIAGPMLFISNINGVGGVNTTKEQTNDGSGSSGEQYSAHSPQNPATEDQERKRKQAARPPQKRTSDILTQKMRKLGYIRIADQVLTELVHDQIRKDSISSNKPIKIQR